MVRFDSLPMEGYDIISFDAWGTDPRVDKDATSSRFGEGRAVWRSRANNHELVISVPRQIMLEGSVRRADGSPPPVSMQISVSARTWGSVGTQIDYAGNFTFFANANEIVSVHPITSEHRHAGIGVASAMLNVDVGDGWRTPAPRFDFVLVEGTKVFGKVAADDSGKPLSQMRVAIFDMAYDRKEGPVETNRLFIAIEVNAAGEFETRLPQGRFRFKINEKESDVVLEIGEGDAEVQINFDAEGKGTIKEMAAVPL